MVLGKLFLILSLNTAQAQSWSSPAFTGWANPTDSASIVFNMAKWFSASLSKEDKMRHQQAVYHALNNLENGELVEWFNNATDSQGKVQISYTWPAGGTICRRVYSFVRKDTNARSYQDTACMDNNQKTWTFVDKY
jgi:surface antigen